jgi:predicted nucleic acid-binding protein
MAANVVVDASFLIALLSRRDRYRGWAIAEAADREPPWKTCEAALSETFLMSSPGERRLLSLLERGVLRVDFSFDAHRDRVLTLMRKYENVPMSLADACLVRMTEVLSDPIVLTTDSDFRIYRRHGRQVVPCAMPR